VNAPTTEPPDHHVYDWVSFNRDTFEFYLAAVRFYESLLEHDLKAVREDEDLRAILGDQALDSYPIAKELKRIQRVRQWFEERIAKGGKDAWDYDVNISHGTVRLVKSVSALYLGHLRRRRQVIASRPVTSKSMLETVDQQLARFEEKTQLGVLNCDTIFPRTQPPTTDGA